VLTSPAQRPLRSLLKIADFYSARQWHSTGMYTDHYRPQGLEHELQLCLPGGPGPTRGTGRTVRLYFFRGPGPDFSERDRAVLTLLRPHLHQAYVDAERRRRPVPQLTTRQQDLLQLVAAGYTNTQIARRLGISEGTVRTHLENIYGRLGVSSRPPRSSALSPTVWRSRLSAGRGWQGSGRSHSRVACSAIRRTPPQGAL
jgi:DNA-binding CsgD family transcriptional regulator